MSEQHANHPRQYYKIGFLMDPYESLNLETETSLLCMEQLSRRGHDIYWIEQSQISLRNDSVQGSMVKVRSISPFETEPDTIALTELNALVIRKDPPFDQSYLHLTYLLDFLPNHVIQVNSSTSLRNINEKLQTQKYPDVSPDSLVSQHLPDIIAFANLHEKIVIKPLDDCSGRGIVFISRNTASPETIIEGLLEEHCYLLAQEFLPGIRNGDKRVYLVNGEPVGSVNRVPAAGSDLANIHQGATCYASTLTQQEETISKSVGADLVREHILLAGLDFIDGRLTEINITSPSAVRQINLVSKSCLEVDIADGIESMIESGLREY